VRIETGRRFVEQQHHRDVHQRSGEAESLPGSATKLASRTACTSPNERATFSTTMDPSSRVSVTGST